ncbi:hypothetical protein [Burkholderia mayonis]|uniref:hypothetical protein n=1 Tax=Burkholderia mayonis TaxID=1385591 RepID=UPI001939FB6E|nr:hypothetical protein [Burkholderia mayonis]
MSLVDGFCAHAVSNSSDDASKRQCIWCDPEFYLDCKLESLEPAPSHTPDAAGATPPSSDAIAYGLSQVPLVESFGPMHSFFSRIEDLHRRTSSAAKHDATNNGDAKRHNNAENWHVKPIGTKQVCVSRHICYSSTQKSN